MPGLFGGNLKFEIYIHFCLYAPAVKRRFKCVLFLHMSICITHAAAPLAITESLYQVQQYVWKLQHRRAMRLIAPYPNIWNVSKSTRGELRDCRARSNNTHATTYINFRRHYKHAAMPPACMYSYAKDALHERFKDNVYTCFLRRYCVRRNYKHKQHRVHEAQETSRAVFLPH